ncbi:MAG TPA: SCO family protein [Pyrinomonadaceae bacterium]|jgi:protein SCO1/2
MKSIKYKWGLVMLALLVTGLGSMARAQEPPAPQQPAAPKTQETTENKAQKYFTDTILINQDGQRMRFYSDLLKDKTVIIDTFFATCTASCLPMNRNLAQIQEALGDRLGKDLHIISISVDSTVDTPTALKAYSKKLNARPGWYFLTGDKESVDFILKKLGQFVDDKNGHLNIFLIGNDRTGLWKKAFGLAKSDELMKVVESVLNDPGAAKP